MNTIKKASMFSVNGILEPGFMEKSSEILNKYIFRPLTELSENAYLSAIRAGMVSVAAPTIIGSIFLIIAFFPISGWSHIIEPYKLLLRILLAAILNGDFVAIKGVDYFL